jgi:hypothetical protein
MKDPSAATNTDPKYVGDEKSQTSTKVPGKNP